MTAYSYLTRSELVTMLMNKENELTKQKLKTEPAAADAKKNWIEVKASLETDITAIQNRLKETMPTATTPPVPADGEQSVTPLATDQTMIKSMKEQSIIQNLLDVIRTVTKMATGDSMEKFIAEMDQIYQVEVEEQLQELPKLEDEFVRGTKRLLPHVMFSQMSKSGQDTTTWDNLKKYLITNHGSKITMFQHLTRLWNLEAKPEDKLTDFGAKLEEETHTAAMHIKKLFTKNHTKEGQTDIQMSADDVFKLMAAMLASIQVRKNHEDIYKAMIKKMDNHWTASSLVADAQDYVDRLGATNDVTKTGAEISFAAKPKHTKSSDQKKSSVQKSSEDESSKAIKELQQQNEAIQKAIKSLTLTNASSQTGGRVRLSMNKGWSYNKKRPRNEQICFKFNNGICTGTPCPDGRRHVDENTAQIAMEESHQEQSCQLQQQCQQYQPGDSAQLDSLFQLGPDM